MTAVVWFRQDLRIADQAALSAAARAGGAVVPLFVLDDASPGRWRPGGASRWWLHQSLQALTTDLARLGSPLVLRRGAAVEAVAGVARAAAATCVFVTGHAEPHWRAADEALRPLLAAAGIGYQMLAGTTLFAPGSIRNRGGGQPRLFAPFWRACQAAEAPPRPLPPAAALRPPSQAVPGDDLADWQLLPTRPDWAGGLRATWRAGEASAQERLGAFLDGAIGDYHRDRDRPEPAAATSRLSPHLHFGELSPRQVWHAVAARIEAEPRLAQGGWSWLCEVGWREFCGHLLVANPQMPDQPLQGRFANFPWADDPAALRAWQRGETGYPIVDAGMRQLWQTGWMHNRVRMIAASFLVKHLLVPWQQGEAWFWDTLVDADLANNAGNWQWVAGCGLDAAPYFRIFNPVLQGEKFDSRGDYVRRWLPELAKLPAQAIHRPWQAAPQDLAAAGVRLGTTYPQPIVDHAQARARALAAIEGMRSRHAADR